MTDYRKIENIPVFFIVGRARSGTTLLQTMLDAHPSVIVPGESCILMYLKNKYYRQRDWSNQQVDLFLSDVLKEKKLYRFWKLDINGIKEQIYAIPETARNFTLLCKLIYVNYPSLFGHTKVKIIGDKNPIYTLFIEDLIELFPDAKFIHIIRDFRDNIVSNREAFSLKNCAALAHAWKYHNAKVENAKLNYPERFIMLRYEDLAADPANQMQKICRFLNITYTPDILHYHEAISKTEYSENSHLKKIHGNLLNPVNTNKVDSWKKKLSLTDIALAEYIAGEDAMTYGYLPSIQKTTNFGVYLKSIYGNLNNRIICFIVILYYHSPFMFKKMLAFVSKKIHDWFNLKNFYNQSDFAD